MTVVLRAAAAYWILLIAVRLVGRRTASMMAPFDLIVLFLFGGATMASVLGEDHSLVAAYSTVATIGLMHLLVSWLKLRSATFGRLIDGTPVVIYEDGHWHEGRMRTLRIEPQDVRPRHGSAACCAWNRCATRWPNGTARFPSSPSLEGKQARLRLCLKLRQRASPLESNT